MAAEPLSLLEFVHELLADAGLRGAFADDPRATLHAYGLGGLSPADVRDALVLAQDNEITDFRPGPDTTAAFGHGAAVADPWWAHDGQAVEHPAWPAGDDFGAGHDDSGQHDGGYDVGWHLT